MSRFRSHLSLVVVVMTRLVFAFIGGLSAPVRRIWPEAASEFALLLRSLGVRPASHEDAKPAARRVAAYQVRLAERLDLSRVAVSGLFLAA
jgi:hypothetical protein